jgi:hypothetical protein
MKKLLALVAFVFASLTVQAQTPPPLSYIDLTTVGQSFHQLYDTDPDNESLTFFPPNPFIGTVNPEDFDFPAGHIVYQVPTDVPFIVLQVINGNPTAVAKIKVNASNQIIYLPFP